MDGRKIDIVIDRCPDASTGVYLFVDGVMADGGSFHERHVDPGASGPTHQWCVTQLDMAADTPAVVRDLVSDLVNGEYGYHTCDEHCRGRGRSRMSRASVDTSGAIWNRPKDCLQAGSGAEALDQCFVSDLRHGDRYCPGGYDTADESAWLPVWEVIAEGDEWRVRHALADDDGELVEDDEDNDAIFDGGALVHVRHAAG